MMNNSRKNISVIFFILTILISVVTGFVYQQGSQYITQTIKLNWWNTDYDYRRQITITHNISGWLSGWDKRVKITIDSNDVDSELYDFPVLVYLSNSSGLDNDDVSFIYDELQNDTNRKKIAVTTSDGTTQCYVEIEKWDTANEQAWLWVKVPNISNVTDTHLYLYYDIDHANNTIYVGDVGSTQSEAVWDSRFKAVWHLGESTNGTGAIKDSTSNSNNGTDNGGPTLGATGKIGNAIHFDGNDDCVVVPDDTSLHLGSGLTIEAWINIDVWGDWEDIVFKGGGTPSDSDYQFALVSTGLAWDGTYGGSWRTKYFPTSQDTGTWIYAVVTHDTVTVKCYRDGSEISSQPDAGAIYESTYQLGISREGAANSGYLNGTIDEIRISNTTRSPAWVKASYESGRDNLLDYGSVEAHNPPYWLSGWDKRVKITIDSNDVGSKLFDFPVLIYLSNSSGLDNDDVSFIFDELQSDANRKKIAVTTSDGTTQCYVEIERWDAANEKAWLWVRVPTISNTADTHLYLYYDADQADNTDYVDDTNTGNSTNVWESIFKAVLHLDQSPSGQTDEMKDSTSYINHGTTEGSMNSTDLVDAKIGKGLEFDEIDDLIRIPNSTSLSFNKSSGTCELWIYWADAADGDHQIVMASSNRFTTGARDGLEWASQGSGNHFFYPWGGDDSNYNLGPNPFTNGVWHHLVVTYQDTGIREVKIYVDTVNMNFTTENVPTYWTQLANTSDWLWGGNPDRPTRYFDGIFDEIRIHSEARSVAWINASYESGRDDLLDYGSEENSSLSSGYSVSATLDTASLVSSGKMLSNGSDLRVVYLNESSWVELDRYLEDMNTSSTQIWFKTQGDIPSSVPDDNYFLYYGNIGAGSPPAYWSDSMGADNSSEVYLAADDFQEHNSGDAPDGWDPCNGYFHIGASGSNRFMNSTASGQYVFAGSSTWTDYVVKLEMQAPTGSVSYPGIAIRVTDVNNLVYFGWRNSTTLTLWKRIDSVYTLLGDWTIPDVGTAWHTLEIRVKDQDLYVYHDETYYGNASLGASELTSGEVGIFSSYGTQGHWDDYIVREYVSPEPSTVIGPEIHS